MEKYGRGTGILIAVGQTLRHLVAKCVAVQVSYAIVTDLTPRLLGCGVPFVCVAAVQDTRCYLQNLDPRHLMLKCDAFTRQNKVLVSVKAAVPKYFTFACSAYEIPLLRFVETISWSQLRVCSKGIHLVHSCSALPLEHNSLQQLVTLMHKMLFLS